VSRTCAIRVKRHDPGKRGRHLGLGTACRAASSRSSTHPRVRWHFAPVQARLELHRATHDPQRSWPLLACSNAARSIAATPREAAQFRAWQTHRGANALLESCAAQPGKVGATDAPGLPQVHVGDRTLHGLFKKPTPPRCQQRRPPGGQDSSEQRLPNGSTTACRLRPWKQARCPSHRKTRLKRRRQAHGQTQRTCRRTGSWRRRAES